MTWKAGFQNAARLSIAGQALRAALASEPFSARPEESSGYRFGLLMALALDAYDHGADPFYIRELLRAHGFRFWRASRMSTALGQTPPEAA